MSGIRMTEVDDATIPTPATGKRTLFADDTLGFAQKDDTGTTTSLTGATGATGPSGPPAYPIEIIDHGNCGAAETFDFGDGSVVPSTSGPVHLGTVDDDLTVTLATDTGADEEAIMTIELVMDGTGGWVVDLPASVVNAADMEGAIDDTPGGINLLVFRTTDGGANWLGIKVNPTTPPGSLGDHTHEATGTGSNGGGASLAPDDLTLPGGGLITVGTSFPGSPSDNDIAIRTDLPCAIYRYEATGTMWRCTAQHSISWISRTAVGAGIAATTTSFMNAPTLGDAGDMWIDDFHGDLFATATNDGTNYWTIQLQKLDAANAATLIATLSTQSNTAANWVKEKVDVDAAVVGATYLAFRVDVTKVASSNTVIPNVGVTWRHLFDV